MTAPGSNKTLEANLPAKGSLLLPGLLDVGSNSFPEFSVGNVLMEAGKEQTLRIRNPSSSFTRMNVTILVVVIKAGMTSNKLLIRLEELLGLRTKC